MSEEGPGMRKRGLLTMVATGIAVPMAAGIPALAGPGGHAKSSPLTQAGLSLMSCSPGAGGKSYGSAVLALAGPAKKSRLLGSVTVKAGTPGTKYSVMVGRQNGACQANTKDTTLTLDKAGNGTAVIDLPSAGPGSYYVYLHNPMLLGTSLASSPEALK